MPGVSGDLAADSRTFVRDSSDNGGKMSKEDIRYAKDFESELRDKGFDKQADATHLAVADENLSSTDRKNMIAANNEDKLEQPKEKYAEATKKTDGSSPPPLSDKQIEAVLTSPNRVGGFSPSI